MFVLRGGVLPIRDRNVLNRIVNSGTRGVRAFSGFFASRSHYQYLSRGSNASIFMEGILLVRTLFCLASRLLSLVRFVLKHSRQVRRISVSVNAYAMGDPGLHFGRFFTVRTRTSTTISRREVSLVEGYRVFYLAIYPRIRNASRYQAFVRVLNCFFVNARRLVLS